MGPMMRKFPTTRIKVSAFSVIGPTQRFVPVVVASKASPPLRINDSFVTPKPNPKIAKVAPLLTTVPLLVAPRA